MPPANPLHPPTRFRRIALIVVVFLLNVVLAAGALALLGTPTRVALAQDDKPPATPEDGGVRFDAIPHPYTEGALAYSLGDRWDRTDLTYYFHNCPSRFDCDDGWDVVRDAFGAWSDLSTLTFTEVGDSRDADIILRWSASAPELGWVGDVLAFATFPSDGGDVTFDDAEPWTAYDRGSFDLHLVAMHEIGHALGIAHSNVPNALMYPVLNPSVRGLTEDDQAAVQALYGTPEQRRPEQEPEQVPEGGEELTVSGTIDDQIPFEMWEFDAFAGETLTFTMETTSGDLTPYVGILTDDEQTVLAEGGEVAPGVAQVTYTFPRDGVYVAVAAREGVERGTTSGDYVLTLSEGEADVPDSGSVAPQPTGDDILLDIRSYSAEDICEIYISPTTDENWGENQLDDVLTNGNLREFFVKEGLYDVLVVTCSGTELEQYEIDVDRDMAIEVYDDDLNPVVYRD